MASSYTNLLKFNKPGPGDTGWGTSVNGGFTDMAEQALTGVVDVAVTPSATTVVPAIASGTTSDARNQFLNITGTLTGGVATVQLPAGNATGNKLYFIKNSAGGDVTVETSGGTTVVVPNGKAMMLRVTSTGVEEAMTHLSGTPTAPTAAPGTNTTQIATTAFVQAAATAALQTLHPIGSIYINATNATNPGTLLGFGTWVAFGAGRVPVGFDSGNPLFDTAEETGGSANAIVVTHDHTFSATTDTQGAHNHTVASYGSGGGPIINSAQPFYADSTINTGTAGAHNHSVSGTTASSGSSGTDANYQPYITVYMWKRTA